MSEPTFDDYLRKLRHHPDEGVRANAAWQLGRTRDHRCLQALLDAARDPSALVRARVMEALGSRRDPEVVKAVAHGLNDPDADVRAMAARAAALMAATELTPHLLELLGDPSERVVEEAIQALAYSDDPDVGPYLIEMLVHRVESDTMRYFLRQALKRRGGPEVVDAAIELLANPDTLPSILCDLLEVLAHVQDPIARPSVEALVNHPDEAVRSMAQWALTLI